MGFTSCKFACPRIISDMQRIEKELGADADKIGFLFFSFDTEGDSPAQMKSAKQENQLREDRWTFAVSTGPIVRQLAVALDFKFQTVDGFFAHSNLIALLDAEGNILHREEALGADIEPTLKAIRQLLQPR